jgi:long-chain acyl-CoA synthetase
MAGGEAPPEVMKAVAAGIGQMVPPTGRALLCGPFYHSAQWAFTFLPLLGGTSVVMRHRFDAAETLEVIDRHAVTNIHLVPTQMKRLLDAPAAAKAAFSGASLQGVWHGAAPCPPVVKRGMIDWWGPKITEYYGSTEGSIISTITAEEWLAKGGSVGRPSPMVEVLVIDEAGERVAGDGEGQLYFRNLTGADFRYHNDEAKTAAAHLAPGVFTTGDVGRIDADGYLWLTDRKIDMIISGGVNIYPAEIEGVLAEHADVADVAVIGVPDDEFGENVKGVVQPREGVAPGPALEAALRERCFARLARYKAPKSFDFVEVLPRNGSGKLLKAALRAPYWAGRDRRI